MVEQDPETYAIIGAAMEVHAQLGHGFLESVYHEALCRELDLRGIPFRREVPFKINYKGFVLGSSYRADLICFDSVIVELKAIKMLTGVDIAQLLNYLKASRLHSRSSV
jgi:GxxExxY protein